MIISVSVAANANVTRKYSETYTDGATEEELKFLDLVMSALCPVTYRDYKEQEKLGIDSACILNWYCSYERRRFAGK